MRQPLPYLPLYYYRSIQWPTLYSFEILALIYSFSPKIVAVCPSEKFVLTDHFKTLFSVSYCQNIAHPIVLYNYYMFRPFLAIMQVLNNMHLWRVIVKPAWWWLETTIGFIIFSSCVHTENKYRHWLTNAVGCRYRNLHCVPPMISVLNTEARCFFTTVLPTYLFNSHVGGGMCLRNVGSPVSGCIASNLRIHLRSYKSPLIIVA